MSSRDSPELFPAMSGEAVCRKRLRSDPPVDVKIPVLAAAVGQYTEMRKTLVGQLRGAKRSVMLAESTVAGLRSALEASGAVADYSLEHGKPCLGQFEETMPALESAITESVARLEQDLAAAQQREAEATAALAEHDERIKMDEIAQATHTLLRLQCPEDLPSVLRRIAANLATMANAIDPGDD